MEGIAVPHGRLYRRGGRAEAGDERGRTAGGPARPAVLPRKGGPVAGTRGAVRGRREEETRFEAEARADACSEPSRERIGGEGRLRGEGGRGHGARGHGRAGSRDERFAGRVGRVRLVGR